MSRAEINNAILSMRPDVRQARVRCVVKWVKKINELKKRKGDENQLQKNKCIRERLIAQVLALKTVKDDEITIFALTNTRTQKDLLEDKKLNLKIRAIAQVSFFEKLQEKITAFKKKYPNYKECLSTKKKEIMKIISQNVKPNRKMNDNGKGEKSNNSSTDDLIKKYNVKPDSLVTLKKTDDNEKVKKDKNKMQEGSTEEENTDEEDLTYKNKKIKSEKTETQVTLHNLQRQDKQPNVNIPKNKDTKFKKINVEEDEEIEDGHKKEKNTQVYLSSKKIKLKNIDEDEDEEEDEDEDEEEEGEEEEEEEEEQEDKEIKLHKEIEKEVDPFFITDDSHTYMRIKAPKFYENDSKEFKGNKSFAKKRDKFLQSHDDTFSNNSFNNKSFKPSNNKFNKNCNNKFNEKHNKFNKNCNTTVSNYDKNKSLNSKFGNKFVKKGNEFNEQKSNNYQKNKVLLKKPNNLNQKFSKSPAKQQQNLHPSWEARKKQQEVSKLGFQGKKIVFNDE